MTVQGDGFLVPPIQLGSVGGRGAFPAEQSFIVRWGGLQGRANAGMSSEQSGENPGRRKPKVSCAPFVYAANRS